MKPGVTVLSVFHGISNSSQVPLGFPRYTAAVAV